MVPKYSERRHRLNPFEVDPVMEAVGFRLRKLVEEKEDLRTAEILFRVYFRLREYVTSRPCYPLHSTWEEISAFLSFGTISEEEVA